MSRRGLTPERAARLVARWTRRSTRGLPEAVAARRAAEIDADLHDHIAHERARGTGERRIALRILSRMVRGLPADAAWRRRVRTREGAHMRSPFAILAALAIAALGIAAVMYGESDDAPGLALIGIVLVVGAIVLTARTQRSR